MDPALAHIVAPELLEQAVALSLYQSRLTIQKPHKRVKALTAQEAKAIARLKDSDQANLIRIRERQNQREEKWPLVALDYAVRHSMTGKRWCGLEVLGGLVHLMFDIECKNHHDHMGRAVVYDARWREHGMPPPLWGPPGQANDVLRSALEFIIDTVPESGVTRDNWWETVAISANHRFSEETPGKPEWRTSYHAVLWQTAAPFAHILEWGTRPALVARMQDCFIDPKIYTGGRCWRTVGAAKSFNTGKTKINPKTGQPYHVWTETPPASTRVWDYDVKNEQMFHDDKAPTALRMTALNYSQPEEQLARHYCSIAVVPGWAEPPLKPNLTFFRYREGRAADPPHDPYGNGAAAPKVPKPRTGGVGIDPAAVPKHVRDAMERVQAPWADAYQVTQYGNSVEIHSHGQWHYCVNTARVHSNQVYFVYSFGLDRLIQRCFRCGKENQVHIPCRRRPQFVLAAPAAPPVAPPPAPAASPAAAAASPPGPTSKPSASNSGNSTSAGASGAPAAAAEPTEPPTESVEPSGPTLKQGDALYSAKGVSAMMWQRYHDRLVTLPGTQGGYLLHQGTQLWKYLPEAELRYAYADLAAGVLERHIGWIRSVDLAENATTQERKDRDTLLAGLKGAMAKLADDPGSRNYWSRVRHYFQNPKLVAQFNVAYPMLAPYPPCGVVDLVTGQCHRRRADHFFTAEFCCAPEDPATATGQANLKRMRQILDEVWPQPGLCAWMLKMMSLWCALDAKTRAGVFLIGEGSNFKTVLMGIMQHLMGKTFAIELKSSALSLAGRASTAEAHTSQWNRITAAHRFAFVGESGKKSYQEEDGRPRVDPEAWKRFAGGDSFIKRGLNQEEEEVTRTGLTPVFCANKTPKLDFEDDAMVDRTFVVPFIVRFLGPERCDGTNPRIRLRDPELQTKITQTLLPALFRLIVEASVARHAEGPQSLRTTEPVCMMQAKREMADEAKPSYDLFFDPALGHVTKSKLVYDKKTWTAFSDIYPAYRAWCMKESMAYESEKRVGEFLKTRFSKDTTHNNNRPFYSLQLTRP